MRRGSNVNILTDNYRVNGDGAEYFIGTNLCAYWRGGEFQSKFLKSLREIIYSSLPPPQFLLSCLEMNIGEIHGVQHFLNPSIEETVFFHSGWNNRKILTVDLLNERIHLTNDSEEFINGYSTFGLTPSSVESILSGRLLEG